ncbi:MAG TPA: alpha/beta hydrolase [Kofleriaceae bacterium]|nr:alpha/beta hydrolase [Kofleriaceae bacterium]
MVNTATPEKSTIVRSRNTLRLARAALQTAYMLSDDLGTSLAERLFTTPRRHRRPERERAVLATGHPLAIDVTLRSPLHAGQHRKLAAWRWGIGPTVLLVHGWEGRASQLGALVEPLVAARLSVVAFDAPGHGDSPDHRLYLTDLADCIADVADATGPLHAIVAHSFGAQASLFARSRGGVVPARTALIAPNVLVEDAVRRFAQRVGLDDVDRGALQDRLAIRNGIDFATLTLDRLTADASGPMMIVHDPGDREVPFEHGARLAALWPGADLRITRGLGHRRILRDPEVIRAIVAFVSQGVPAPKSDLVREIDRALAEGR